MLEAEIESRLYLCLLPVSKPSLHLGNVVGKRVVLIRCFDKNLIVNKMLSLDFRLILRYMGQSVFIRPKLNLTGSYRVQ